MIVDAWYHANAARLLGDCTGSIVLLQFGYHVRVFWLWYVMPEEASSEQCGRYYRPWSNVGGCPRPHPKPLIQTVVVCLCADTTKAIGDSDTSHFQIQIKSVFFFGYKSLKT